MQNGPVEIPNKSSFKINEVCALTGVKSYVLRFWESEFPEITPIQSSSGVKLYEHRDIEAILLIKKLLFEDKLSIERAKAELKNTMPKDNLVDQAFTEAENIDYQDSNHEFNLRESVTKRVLIESEFQKLILAKNNLIKLLNRIELVEKQNNWA